jgi:hypothetical protein
MYRHEISDRPCGYVSLDDYRNAAELIIEAYL